MFFTPLQFFSLPLLLLSFLYNLSIATADSVTVIIPAFGASSTRASVIGVGPTNTTYQVEFIGSKSDDIFTETVVAGADSYFDIGGGDVESCFLLPATAGGDVKYRCEGFASIFGGDGFSVSTSSFTITLDVNTLLFSGPRNIPIPTAIPSELSSVVSGSLQSDLSSPLASGSTASGSLDTVILPTMTSSSSSWSGPNTDSDPNESSRDNGSSVHHNKTGIIIGSTIGALSALLITVTLLLCIKRRQRLRRMVKPLPYTRSISSERDSDKFTMRPMTALTIPSFVSPPTRAQTEMSEDLEKVQVQPDVPQQQQQQWHIRNDSTTTKYTSQTLTQTQAETKATSGSGAGIISEKSRERLRSDTVTSTGQESQSPSEQISTSAYASSAGESSMIQALERLTERVHLLENTRRDTADVFVGAGGVRGYIDGDRDGDLESLPSYAP